MKILLGLTGSQKDKVWEHLLPDPLTCEKAAFIFAHPRKLGDSILFTPKEIYLAKEQDFVRQQMDYLELNDAARISLIKRAHELEASLIEFHSHPFPGPWAAAFSLADRQGLQEIVPHMWWRLNKRPYGAIVVAPEGFDALMWWNNPEIPEAIEGILVDEVILKPTNRSLEGWAVL